MDTPMNTTGRANIVVPNLNASVQDLGPFQSGRQMITDILPGSALVCHAVNETPLIDDEGYVFFAFEGNANGAANLVTYYEKCLCGAGRLKTSYPSIAYGRARIEDLTVVASYDLDRLVFDQVLDREAMEVWSGENIQSFLPPKIETPCADLDLISPLLTLPMRSITTDLQKAAIWKLEDGTLVVKVRNEPICIYSHHDDKLHAIVATLELDPDLVISILGSESR